jgi:phage terminase large subunit-like protein
MSNYNIALKYISDVLDETIPACIYVKQAAQRFLDDLANPAYYYDATEVDKVISFINVLNLTEQVTPKKFFLE